VVLGQADVEAKTNEIPMFSTLLDRIDLAGAVVTADALHAQRAHAGYLVTQRGAHYLITVKGNQPDLHAQLAGLPWRQVPVAHQAREKGHGRTERRTLKVTAVAAGLAFPHAAQAIQIVRRRRPLTGRKWSAETVYAITSLSVIQARPADLARFVRGHWESRTGCTGSATSPTTSPTTRTAPRSAPATGPASWPACATWPSPSCV